MLITLKQIALLCALGTASLAAVAQTTTFANLQNLPGWKSCTACAGGRGRAVSGMTGGVGSPSLDGVSARFDLASKWAFSNALWWLHVADNSSAANFTLDLQQYLADPLAPQAIEYAVTQSLAGGWYKFSTQCSFSRGIWRVWDSHRRAWTATTAPCTRPAAQTWTHLTFQYQRANGMATFVAITVGGQTYYLNQSFRPQPIGGSRNTITVHYQLDGNRTRSSVNAYLDEVSLTVW